jgi:hypothetical protein
MEGPCPGVMGWRPQQRSYRERVWVGLSTGFMQMVAERWQTPSSVLACEALVVSPGNIHIPQLLQRIFRTCFQLWYLAMHKHSERLNALDTWWDSSWGICQFLTTFLPKPDRKTGFRYQPKQRGILVDLCSVNSHTCALIWIRMLDANERSNEKIGDGGNAKT